MKTRRAANAVLAIVIAVSGTSIVSPGAAHAATSCVNPVALKEPVSLNVNADNSGSQVGVLYLGYFASCRKTYAEFHFTDLVRASQTVTSIWIHDLFSGKDYGYTQISGSVLWSNGGWADTQLLPIDSPFYADAIEPVVHLSFYSGPTCGMVGWSHEFDNGQASSWDTGHFGSHCL